MPLDESVLEGVVDMIDVSRNGSKVVVSDEDDYDDTEIDYEEEFYEALHNNDSSCDSDSDDSLLRAARSVQSWDLHQLHDSLDSSINSMKSFTANSISSMPEYNDPKRDTTEQLNDSDSDSDSEKRREKPRSRSYRRSLRRSIEKLFSSSSSSLNRSSSPSSMRRSRTMSSSTQRFTLSSLVTTRHLKNKRRKNNTKRQRNKKRFSAASLDLDLRKSDFAGRRSTSTAFTSGAMSEASEAFRQCVNAYALDLDEGDREDDDILPFRREQAILEQH